MKLISLDLTNYRRFKSATLEFPEGVIGILGLNGVGKSTIIEAISWALYGNESRIVRTSKEDLKRYGAAATDECAVELEFELDGDKYKITRKMVGKNYQTSAEAEVNGKSVATSTKSVTSLIEQRLGMDYQAFYTSVFAKQKELNALSVLDPSKRKKLILRMLNIDSIDKAIISVRGNKRDLDSRLSEIRSNLTEPDGTPKADTVKDELKGHEMKVVELQEKISKMTQERNKKQERLNEVEAARRKQRGLREEHNKISTKLAECNTRLENTVKQQEKVNHDLSELLKHEVELKGLEPKIAAWKKVKTRKNELDKLQDDFIRAEGLKKQLKDVEEKIKIYDLKLKSARKVLKKFENLEDEMEKCQDALEKVNQEIDDHKKEISEANSKSSQIDTDMKNLETKLKNIQKLGADSECPTCERALGEHYKILEDKFTSQLKDLSTQQKNFIKNLEKINSELNDSTKRKDALKKREKHQNELFASRASTNELVGTTEQELKQHNKRKAELVAELKQYKDLKFDPKEYNRVKNDYQALEKVNEKYISLKERVEAKPKLDTELTRLKKLHTEQVKTQKQLETQLTKLGFDKTKLDEFEAKFEEESNKLNEFKLGLKETENELTLNKKDIDQLTAKLKELKELNKKAEEYKDKLIYLAKLDEILDKFKSYMISRIAPTLTQFASDLFRELTDGRYNRLEVDNDYNVFIYDNGKEFPLERFSGGEEDLANLCLRLAISQVIAVQAGSTGPNFVILDEIFGSQDLFRKRNLLQALNGLTNKFRQIFLITHIEDVKEYIGYNILVSETEDNASMIQVVA